MSEMELKEAVEAGEKLAEYFVYCCGEGDHYVELVERLREANTRYALLEAVYILLHYGDQYLNQKMGDMNQKRLENLFQFFRTGEIENVSHFRANLVASISMFELEKIHQQEKYLVELLS
jgi:polynucleotide 5'-kinase involved in rRNA processing